MPVSQTSRAIDYSSPGINGDGAKMCQNEIVKFVRGIRGPRSQPVTAAQIVRWMRATPSDFVQAQIDAALMTGRLEIHPRSLGSSRRASGAYVYTAD